MIGPMKLVYILANIGFKLTRSLVMRSRHRIQCTIGLTKNAGHENTGHEIARHILRKQITLLYTVRYLSDRR